MKRNIPRAILIAILALPLPRAHAGDDPVPSLGKVVDPAPKSIVFDAAFSPDGKQVALACEDKVVRLYDWPAGKQRAVLEGHSERVWSAAFSPDGKWLASCTGEYRKAEDPGELKVWDLATGKVIANLNGHTALIFHVVFSPDGKSLVSTGWDSTVRLWNVATWQEQAVLKGHTGPVRCAAFAPGGQSFATAGFDGTARLWDAATGKPLAVLKAHEKGVQRVLFSPDGKHLATASRSATSGHGEIKLWDHASGEEITTIEVLKSAVMTMDYSTDGAMLAIGGGSSTEFGEVKLLELASGQVRADLHGHKEWVECVRFAPDGRRLVSAGGYTRGKPGEVRIWSLADLRDGDKVERLSVKQVAKLWDELANKDAHIAYHAVQELSAAPLDSLPLLKEKLRPALPADPKRIAALIAKLDHEKFAEREEASNELAKVADLARVELKKAHAETNSAEVKRRTALLLRGASFTLTSTELLRAIRAVEVLEAIATPEARQLLESLAKGAPGARLSEQSRDALERLKRRGEPLAKPAALDFLAPPGAKVAVDGKDIGPQATFVVGDLKPDEIRRLKVEVKFADGGGEEHLVDVQPGQRIPVPLARPGKDKPVAVATQPLAPIMSMALSRDGRLIAIGLDNGAAVLWDLAAGRPTRSFLGHRAAVQSIAFSPDGSQILTGSADATAILWDVRSAKQTRLFKGHEAAIMSVAFTPDAKRIATGSVDKTAIVWNAGAGEPIRTLKGHKKEVFGVACSPDGATLATASFDATAILWDIETGKEKLVLRGHKEEVSCVAFSPDGGMLATGSYENKSIVWETATGKRLGVSGRHDNDIYSLTFTTDGKRFITGDREGVIMMWDIPTGKKLRDFTGHIWEVSSVTTSADGRWLVTGSRDGTVKLWDMATGLETASLATDASRKGWSVTSPAGFFDGTELGRQMVGYRFLKLPGAVIDQFFNDYYRPGLLTEIARGGRPLPSKPLAGELPPRIKIVSPTARTAMAQDVHIIADIADQGSGVSGLALYHNGVRRAAAKTEPGPDAKTTRATFAVSLLPGMNKVRVKAACADGSWEGTSPELELTYGRTLEHKGRMYAVAIQLGAVPGKGASAQARDVQALADLLRHGGGKHFDRVDVLPLADRDATKLVIEDALRDVAELSRPQDAVVVILRGAGTFSGGRIQIAATDTRGKWDLALDDWADILASARALKRVLIVDLAGAGAPQEEFALRGAVERLSRLQGIHTIASISKADVPKNTSLCQALLSAAQTSEPAGALDVADWFSRVAAQAKIECSSQARGFPILSLGKKATIPE
jgi:WD40 repeat protein